MIFRRSIERTPSDEKTEFWLPDPWSKRDIDVGQDGLAVVNLGEQERKIPLYLLEIAKAFTLSHTKRIGLIHDCECLP